MCGVILMVSKKLLLSTLAFFCFSTISYAEQEEPKQEAPPPEVYWARKPIQCGTLNDVISIVKNFGELPLLTAEGITFDNDGSASNNKIIFGGNKKTGSWTIIEVNSPNQACILGSGKNFSIQSEEQKEIKVGS